MESHADQPVEVHNEKCSINNAIISYFKNKYQIKDIVMLGLMVGARGSITSLFVQFCRQFNLDKNPIKEIVISTLWDSYNYPEEPPIRFKARLERIRIRRKENY
ncbi:hypothetical protein C0J52_04711 [Blattella germanica]|nr:hypothetical protein C0J52_04711 [Blattella germanica]